MTSFSLPADWRYVVIGDPVEHSKSPAMQNAALSALGYGNAYGKVRVRAEELGAFVEAARQNLAGFNITVPHKTAILPFLDEVAPDALHANSVNTVIKRPDGSLYGTSTDGIGIERAVREAFNLVPKGLNIVLFGAGGAAQAIADHYARHGAHSIFWVNRTQDKVADLAARLATRHPKLAIDAASPADPRLRTILREADLVIQATSLGLKVDDPAPFDFSLLDGLERAAGMETIYRTTPFLNAFRKRGLHAADGRGMLLHQGAASLELWLGVPVPLEKMRNALEDALCCV